MHEAPQVRETPCFFGERSQPNFGVLHAPPADATTLGGIVLCPPLAHEFDFSHRMLLEFARRLCAMGLWVQRFDYRGHGDSFGNFADLKVDDYLADIRQAIEVLEHQSGVPCRDLCGLRLGATLAAAVWVEASRPGPLVLWEPVVSGARYLDDLLRAVLAKNMTHKSQAPTTRDTLRSRIADGTPVIFEGRPLTHAFTQSLESLDLETVGRRLAQPTLLVPLSKRPTAAAAPALRKLHSDLSTRCRADLQSVVMPAPWFGSLILEYSARVHPEELFQQTQAWLRQQLEPSPCPTADSRGNMPGSLRDVPVPARHLAPASSPRAGWTASEAGCERPVSFDVEGVRCAGVLHVAPEGLTQRPLLVLPPQGMNLRAGWNQLHVRLARMLGQAGWSSLRFDARGLGQSEGTLDYVSGAELFLAVENGQQVPETRAAIEFAARQLGVSSVILLGVCGGALTTGLLGAAEPRVVGAALVELPLLHTRDPGQAEGKPLWRYREKLWQAETWRRLLTGKLDFRVHLRSLRLVAARLLRAGQRQPTDNRWLLDQLGATANVRLAGAVKECCARGIPMLFAFGSTDNAELYDRVSNWLSAAGSSHVVHHVVEGADHDFLLPEHAQELGQILRDWLEQRFISDGKALAHASGDCHSELPHA